MKNILSVVVILLLMSCGKTDIKNYIIKKDKVNFEELVYLGVDKDNIIFTTFNDKYGSYSYELKTDKINMLDYLVTKKIEEEEIGRKYKNVIKTSKEGLYIYQNENGKYLLFNEKNSKRSETYDLIEEINGKYYVQKNEAKGYIDEEFNTVVALAKYRYLGKIQDNIALAYYNGKWGVAQKNFSPDNFKYEEVYVGKNGNWIVKNQTGNYIDSNGRILDVDTIVQSPNTVIVYIKEDKMGVIDVNTLSISLPIFEEIGADEKTVVIATPEKKYVVKKVKDILNWKKDKSAKDESFLYIEKMEKDRYAGVDKDGNTFLIIEDRVINKKYIEIYVKNKLFLCQKEDGVTFDIYNRNGKLLTTIKKDKIKYIGDYLVYEDDEKYKIIKGVE